MINANKSTIEFCPDCGNVRVVFTETTTGRAMYACMDCEELREHIVDLVMIHKEMTERMLDCANKTVQ